MIAKLFDYSAVILVNQIHPYLSQAKDICAFMFMKKPFSVSWKLALGLVMWKTVVTHDKMNLINITLSITHEYLNYIIPNHKGVDMKAWNFLGHVFRDLEMGEKSMYQLKNRWR